MTSTITRIEHQCDGAVPTREQINTAGVGSQFHYHHADDHTPVATTHFRTDEGWRQIATNGSRRPIERSAWVNDPEGRSPQPLREYRWDLYVPAEADPYAIGQPSNADLIANAPAGTCVGYVPVVGGNFTEPQNYYLIEDDATYFCANGVIGSGEPSNRTGISDDNWVFVANRWNLRRLAQTTAPVTIAEELEPAFGTVEWFTAAPVGTRLRCTYGTVGDRCHAEKVGDDTWRQWSGERREGAFATTPEALVRHNCDWELDPEPTLEPEPEVVDVTALDWTQLSSFETAPAGTELACQIAGDGQHHAIKETDGRWLFWVGVRTANTSLRYRTSAGLLRGHQTGWSLVAAAPAVARGTVLTREVMDSAPDGTVAKYYVNTNLPPMERLERHERGNLSEVAGSQWRKINGQWHNFGGAFDYREPVRLVGATATELDRGNYVVSAVCPVSGPVDTRQQLIDAPLGTEVSVTGDGGGESLNYRKYSTGWRIINADGTVDRNDWNADAFPVPGSFQFAQRTAGLPAVEPTASEFPSIPFLVTRVQMDALPVGAVLQYDLGGNSAQALERFQLGSSFDRFVKISEGTGLARWARPGSHYTPNALMDEGTYGRQVDTGMWIVVSIPTIQPHPYYAVGSSAGRQAPDLETFATLPIGTVMRWSNTLYTKTGDSTWREGESGPVYPDDYWGSPGIITSLPGVTPAATPEPEPVSDDPAAVQARVQACMAEVKAAVRSAQSGEGQDHVAAGAWWLLGVDPLPTIDSTILFGSAFGLPVGSWVSGNGRVYEVTRNDAMYPDFRGGTGPNTMSLTSNVRVLSLGEFEAPVYLGRDDFLSQVWEKERELKARHSWCSKVESRLEDAGLDDPEKIGLPDSPPPPPLQVGDVVNTATDARRLLALPAGSVMSFESRGNDRRHFMRMIDDDREWVEFDGDQYETVSFGSMRVRVEFVSGYVR